MTHARSRDDMQEIGEEFIQKAVERGVEPGVAEQVFSYIRGYAGYGFCEAHAAAFGDTAYRTAYLLRHHPAAFLAATLSNQPMGYYPSDTLCLEARRRGIGILPPDINRSGRNFQVEDGAIRVSLRQVRGMKKSALDAILKAREEASFVSAFEFCARVEVPRDLLENLVLSGAFDPLHPNRRALFWGIERVRRQAQAEAGPLWKSDPTPRFSHDCLPHSRLPDYSELEKFEQEYQILGLTVSCHWMSYYREGLQVRGILSNGDLAEVPMGHRVKAAGLVLRPHRPPTKSGRIVVFFSLEDEFGLSDVTVFENIYQKYGALIFSEATLIVEGRLERRGSHLSIIADQLMPFPRELRPSTLNESAEDLENQSSAGARSRGSGG